MMQFRVTARTVVQLGAELISSDGIAFYELIKNAFDARSSRVAIYFKTPLAFQELNQIQQRLTSKSSDNPDAIKLEDLRTAAQALVTGAAATEPDLLQRIVASASREALAEVLDFANCIEVVDTGSGIPSDVLREAFLTIGTPFRFLERQEHPQRRVLGEKGLGRLSAMRLGWRLLVRTATREEPSWSILDLDWADFTRDPSMLLEDVAIRPIRREGKADPTEHGTTLRIGRLAHEWSIGSVTSLVTEEFSRLTDPFAPAGKFPVTVRFNGDLLEVPSIASELFAAAHAEVSVQFECKPSVRLSGHIRYRLAKRERSFSLGEAQLLSATQLPLLALQDVGPFRAQFYWYNRKALTAVRGIGERQAVQKLLRQWAHGLMVFRDGFRVNPYGGRDDDWLELDKRALGSGGYKVNRHQLLGKVDITSHDNPQLSDQTNREGLRAGSARSGLVAMLQHVMWSEFKAFLDEVTKEDAGRLSLRAISTRVTKERKGIRASVKLLTRRVPGLKEEPEVLTEIYGALDRIDDLMTATRRIAAAADIRRGELLHLAGLGLMLEVVAHELSRTTSLALESSKSLEREALSKRGSSLVVALRAQLRTLHTRLRTLDPLSTTGRQVKEAFDVRDVIQGVLLGRAEQFKRHAIRVSVVGPGGAEARAMTVRMVRGMVVQILENLFENSVYWLRQGRVLDPALQPEIKIILDSSNRTITFADNGPGIPVETGDRVFEAFYTTKPPGEGRGLGLYISRELARYHGADLRLEPAEGMASERLGAFVLTLPKEGS